MYDGPDPVSFSVSPNNSYGAKLLLAYKIMGGFPERDMLLRDSDPSNVTFLTKGSNISVGDPEDTTGGYSDVYSNGRRYRGGQRFDRDVAIRVERLKKWQLEVIKHKREHLEFKIKRALDYSDQLLNEITLLKTMLTDVTRSVDTMVANVLQQAQKPGAQNMVDDSGDKFGLNIGRIGDKTVDTDLNGAKSEALR